MVTGKVSNLLHSSRTLLKSYTPIRKWNVYNIHLANNMATSYDITYINVFSIHFTETQEVKPVGKTVYRLCWTSHSCHSELPSFLSPSHVVSCA
ncbi:hypothetical protein PC129_g16875 [Phytophthora cactorum]|uniref:Uncharacterized protein n=1 Tax=Phytophthora cactorum TaxID=29920 RepID=A0A8T1BVJ5_9STRA|nr:hypothetical protein PC111_g17649 [Phytophthora cactorum]KAG2819601.1 hypothetical protein PC112_g12123 [Phytophthora cactorum]KAG2860851.1 hypothetical protein PC113_g7698 [Phytophthora cactorum]KAG2888401.1 hypothetical protein PC114_g18429 [Phytophthora cactorum]KAG2902030.1 hypothetical protein PC115_g15706 [Phytophthora cactorum]